MQGKDETNLISKNKAFYNSNPNIKKIGVDVIFSAADTKEFIKCASSPIYFIETYCSIISTDDGFIPFKMFQYQKNLVTTVKDNRFSIILAPRQSGKTSASAGFLLWYALFVPDSVIAIVANKGSLAREILSKIALMLETVPFFLQQGCKALNKGSIEWENNSKILAASTSGDALRGMALSIVFLDEFAFFEKSEIFYTSTYPTISSGKTTKIIISSTPNGIGNVFYKMWQESVRGDNTFVNYRITWQERPGRDEIWRAETIKNTSLKQFRQEYETEFLGSSETLIPGEIIASIPVTIPKEIRNENLRIYELPISGHKYVMTADVSRAVGLDYSAFIIFDVTKSPFNIVATFNDSNINHIEFPILIDNVGTHYNNASILIENNDIGLAVVSTLYNEMEYENILKTYKEKNIKRRKTQQKELGLRMTGYVKTLGCNTLVSLMENQKIIINCGNVINEMSNFIRIRGSYAADKDRHDDLMMCLISFAWLTGDPQFKELTFSSISDELIEPKKNSLLTFKTFFTSTNPFFDDDDDEYFDEASFMN